MKFTYKYIRPTDTEHGHTKVFYNGDYVGYLMPDRNWSSPVGCNWRFVGSGQLNAVSMHASNRAKLITLIEGSIK